MRIIDGIDVSNARLDSRLEPSDAERGFNNNKRGRRSLGNWARQQGARRTALEPAGRFHRALHQCLAEAGIEMAVCQPARAISRARSARRPGMISRMPRCWPCSPACSSLRHPSPRPRRGEQHESFRRDRGFRTQERPGAPFSRPPTQISSTSTHPGSRSRCGRTVVRRRLWSRVHAALFRPRPRIRCSPSALAPFFGAVTHQIALNHSLSGWREPWRMVPAVTEA